MRRSSGIRFSFDGTSFLCDNDWIPAFHIHQLGFKIQGRLDRAVVYWFMEQHASIRYENGLVPPERIEEWCRACRRMCVAISRRRF